MKPTLTLLSALLLAPLTMLHAEDTRYAPTWAGIAPKRVIKHTATQNDALAKAVAALQPGDQLVIAASTYSLERM